jgi:hypothetical protein
VNLPPEGKRVVMELQPEVVTGLFTLGGFVLGGASSVIMAYFSNRTQHELQEQRFNRERRAARLSTLAALGDLAHYANAAAAQSHFDLTMWEPSVETLLRRITAPETVHGFSDVEWASISNAASEARLGLMCLKGLTKNPFVEDLNRTNSEVDEEQNRYTTAIRDVGVSLHEQLAAALNTAGIYQPAATPGDISDIIDAFRAPLGQKPIEETRQNPGAKCEVKQASEKTVV